MRNTNEPSASIQRARRPIAVPATAVAASLAALLAAAPVSAVVTAPAGFAVETVANGFDRPIGMSFAPDGRLFVAEQRGMVWIVDPVLGKLPTPFINLQNEVGNAGDRGLLGIALDPSFAENHLVYLLYTVDPMRGQPDEPGETATFSRLTRYAGTAESNGNVADEATRTVLIGAIPSEGIPACYSSHVIGSLRFGFDGSLFVSAGDSASFGWADVGGTTPGCFDPGLFGPEEDIGAYRSQSLDSLAGKVLRVDPQTGAGLESNPFYNGDPFAKRSRLWATGLRNPFRMAIRPGSPAPGTLYIGDVGWNLVEEVNVAKGGENFGWPCYEGNTAAPEYPALDVPFFGCDTIGTPVNPGPLTNPLVRWHHFNDFISFPPGVIGRCAVSGVFYDGSSYPTKYQGRLFYSDHIFGWLRILTVTTTDTYVKSEVFGGGVNGVVDFAAHPQTRDVHLLLLGGDILRMRYVGADLNGDGVVNGADLGILLAAWGLSNSPANLDGIGTVDGADLGILLANWS
ncbi:MAG: PQQ-dependent sugar dehydrogenase [Phycisphaerales bacterium]